MKKELLLLVIGLTSIFAFGQSDPAYIEVYGSAESELTPNIIIVSVRLKEYFQNKTKIPLETIESEFQKALRISKVPEKNVQIADLKLSSFQRRKRDRDFLAQKTFQVEFSSSKEVMTVLNNLHSVQLDYLKIIELTHTEIEKYRLQLKVEALKAAERKADALLNAVDSKRGAPLLIDESQAPTFWTPQNTYSNTLDSFAQNEEPQPSEIPLKKIKLRFQIRARFKIE